MGVADALPAWANIAARRFLRGGTKLRALAAAALLAAATGVFAGATPAAASPALRVYASAPGTYTVQPTSTNHTPIFRDLGARITVPAGTIKYLSSKLIVSRAT